MYSNEQLLLRNAIARQSSDSDARADLSATLSYHKSELAHAKRLVRHAHGRKRAQLKRQITRLQRSLFRGQIRLNQLDTALDQETITISANSIHYQA